MSRMIPGERHYCLQVFTKLALALIDLRYSLNQTLALLLQKRKFLLRERPKLLVWVFINYSHRSRRGNNPLV